MKYIFVLLLFLFGNANASICDSRLVDFGGGAAAGAATTGFIAGDSTLIIATGSGSIAAIIPAVAPVVVIGSAVIAAGYVGTKATCAFVHEDQHGKTNAQYAMDKMKSWYKSAKEYYAK